MKPKKILFVGSYPNKIEEYLYVFFRNLIYEIANLGVECYVVAPVSVTKYRCKLKQIDCYAEEITSKGKKVHVYHPRFFSASSKKIGPVNTSHITTANFMKAVDRCIRKNKLEFDAVYGHFFLNGGLTSNYIGKKYGVPAFMAYGECDYESQVREHHGDLKRKDIDALTGIISVSTKNTGELNDTGLFESTPIFTCPNAIETKLFENHDKVEARKNFNIPTEDFVVGFVGGFIERKGDKRLLEACKDIDGVSLAFAGKGDNPPGGEKVVFCDAVNHERIGEFLKCLDVFVLPTLNEGCCNAVLEAMASGLPIVSSNLPFNDDVLNESNSIRINPMSINEIRDSVVRLKNDSELRQKLASAAYEDSRMFTIEKRGERILEFISKYVN